MKNKTRYALVCMTLLIAYPTLSSWANNTSGAAAPYLRQGVHARYLALGNAGTAIVHDSSAVYWNPAVVSHLRAPSLSAQTALLGWDQSWQYLGFAYPVVLESGLDFGFGLGWISYSAGQALEKRSTNRPDPTSLFKDQQSAIIATLSSSFKTAIHYGLNVKLLMHQLDDDHANGFSLDAALWQQVTPSVQWGLVLQDGFGSITWPSEHQDKLPLIIRPGMSWQILNQKLLVAADGGFEMDFRSHELGHVAYHLGTEYLIFPSLAGRVGLNDNQVTAGLGWQFMLSKTFYFNLDYAFAWERLDTLGHSHLFSIDIMVHNPVAGELIR